MLEHLSRRRLTYGIGAGLAKLILAAAPWALMAQTAPAALDPQSSTEGGVTIKVTPLALGSAGGRRDFAIVLDTHGSDLNDDLTQSATLSAGDGRKFKPATWSGASAGGHHREGVLSFEVPAPRPTEIELRIVRPGESAPRTFRWLQ